MEAASATSHVQFFVHSLKYNECMRNIIVFLEEKLNFICHTQGSHALLSFLVFVRAWGQSANLPLYKIAKIFDKIQFFHFVMSMSLEA